MSCYLTKLTMIHERSCYGGNTLNKPNWLSILDFYIFNFSFITFVIPMIIIYNILTSSNIWFSYAEIIMWICKFSKYDNLILFGDIEENQTLNIIVNKDRKLTTQIWPKWNNFVQTNEFRPGCAVRFNFSINNCYVCHVFHVK
jgi:hypothetical protein